VPKHLLGPAAAPTAEGTIWRYTPKEGELMDADTLLVYGSLIFFIILMGLILYADHQAGRERKELPNNPGSRILARLEAADRLAKTTTILLRWIDGDEATLCPDDACKDALFAYEKSKGQG
jgi:hypothetical protein